MKLRPKINSLVMVGEFAAKGIKKPFLAKVISYDECDDMSIRVRRRWTKDEEWIVDFEHCYNVKRAKKL